MKASFDESFTRWWIAYMKRHYGVGPEMRAVAPYDMREVAAYDAARWAVKRAMRAAPQEKGD